MLYTWIFTYISFAIIGFSSYKAVGSKRRQWWIRIALSAMLLTSAVSFFLPDENNSNAWQINPNKHTLLLFFFVSILTNIIIFLSSSKRSYLVGMCLFYINLALFFAALSVFGVRSTASLLSGFIYFVGAFVPIFYAMSLDSRLIEEDGLMPINPPYLSRFTHDALYLASLCLGLGTILVSVVAFLTKEYELAISSFLFGLAFAIPAIISLIPKRKKA